MTEEEGRVNNRTMMGAAASVALVLSGANAFAVDPIAQQEYSVCASCHGADGKGDGPMVDLLTSKPSDLTKLSANNGGVFPLERVIQIVDGRSPMAAHGSRDMPIWGSRFSSQYTGTGGPLGSEMEVRGRILSIVYYVQTLQEP